MMNDDFNSKLGSFAHGMIKSFLKEKKENINNFLIKNQVGFIPEGFDFSKFNKLKRNNNIKQLKFLIGKKHKYIPIIYMGYYLNSLSNDELKYCIDENRDRIYKKYGKEGISVLNITTTNIMSKIIEWFTKNYLKKNISQNQIIAEFEELIKYWNELSIYIKKENSENHIIRKCKNKILNDKTFFVLFASGSAKKIAKKVSDKLIKDSDFKEAKYKKDYKKVNDNCDSWIFYKELN